MAVNNQVFVVIDRQSGSLASAFGAINQIPGLYLLEQKPFRVQIADPPQSPIPPNNVYVIADYTGYTLDISLGAQPLGAGGTAATSVKNLPWDPVNKWFLGTLDMSQAAVTALLNGGPNVPVYIEFSLWINGYPALTLIQTVTLYSRLDTGAVVNPPQPAPNYPTFTQADARYVSWIIPAGYPVTFLTADPKKQVLLIMGDDLIPKWTPLILP